MNYPEYDLAVQWEGEAMAEQEAAAQAAMDAERKQVFQVGRRIKFAEERRAYTIQACNGRYLVCTKPLNVKNTVLYTIVDLQERVRGTENLVFGMGAETAEKCQEMLARIVSGETEISGRNWVELRIEE